MKNQRVLITGASKGLGAIAAVALAEQGARVVLLARSQDKLESVRQSCTDPERHLSISVDLLELDQIQSAVLKAKNFLGGIDVVLHSAGGGLGFKDDLLLSDEFYKLFALNLGAAAEMIERRSGNLVHVG